MDGLKNPELSGLELSRRLLHFDTEIRINQITIHQSASHLSTEQTSTRDSNPDIFDGHGWEHDSNPAATRVEKMAWKEISVCKMPLVEGVRVLSHLA